MNLAGLTEGQRLSVMHVGGPLLISAGAGSGKTFTLTQRIAYALLSSHSTIADIDEVLAITFTEKAAGEIKARVKSTLRQEGLATQALKVDGAWISTIHGMCSRILRTHALELGIDPGFSVIDDAIRNRLIAEAVDEVLGVDNEIVSRSRYERVFDEFPARSVFPTVPSVASMLEVLLGKAANLKQSFDGIAFGPESRAPKTIARELLQVFEGIGPYLEQAGTSKAAEGARASTEHAIEALSAFIACSGKGTVAGNADGKPSLEDLAQLLEGVAFLPCTFGNSDVKAAIKEYQQGHSRIINEVVLGLAEPVLQDLMGLAREVAFHYEEKKRAAYVLDNDDLLIKTLQAFEDHPGIAAFYSQKFKLVMVDEFQDTSQMQIDIIEKLAGENNAHLCTVGDSQQSIYRFRGADVNVYEAHKETMRSPEVGALSVELTENFRSHRDILSFVDRIFGQAQVFGDRFMSLTPYDKRPTRYCGSGPRIDIVLAVRPAGNNTGVTPADATWSEAQAIAERFAALRAAGHKAGDMVVLLGKMTHAELFAQALRDQDFECVITGGSLFDRAPEVHVISRLAEALANPSNTAALFEVLGSDMFRLGADDFLELSTSEDPETGAFRRCDLHTGFSKRAEWIEAYGATGGRADPGSSVPLRLHLAVRVLDRAWKSLGAVPVSQVARQAVIDSGWLTRLQEHGAFGIAQAGNILKAIRMIEDLESNSSRGPAQVAREFSDRLSLGLKEAPGALTGKENQVVKIMTIHASKGLEFPLVALADFYGVRAASDKLVVETCQGKTYASLSLGESLEKYPLLARRLPHFSPDRDGEGAGEGLFDFEAMPTAADFRAALKAIAHDEELAEARRRFYVGLTRASEALIVSMSVKDSSREPLGAYKDIVDDVRAALCGGDDFPSEKGMLSYGGSQSAAFERLPVVASEGSRVGQRGAAGFAIPRFEPVRSLRPVPSNPLRENVFSYSSLAPSEKRPDATADQAAGVGRFGEGEGWRNADADKATDLGTAFHRLAQYAIETGEAPTAGRIETCAEALALSEEQRSRLREALAAWFSSALYAEACGHATKRAEVPFYLAVDGAWLEGEIDLLCTDGKDRPALVVDYKTGGKPDESDEMLRRKHLLQARCYAYAVLSQGYPRVDMKFVRVEQTDGGSSDPETVGYSFGSEDAETLKHMIVAAYRASFA